MMKILICQDRYWSLSNFSAHKIVFEGVEYMTAEHAYQAAKFVNEAMREKIKNAPSAYLAHEWAQVKEGRAPGFEEKKVAMMKAIMRAKLEQYEEIQDTLRSTGDAVIEKNHPTDFFWGTGVDGSGQNMMGKIWMELRNDFFS